ncbi:MAG: hypothetical protein KBI39_01300 [Firmicutes bacterium]|nr:hypothetical protein [Candidatus Fermentithermobacillaceae bacterium]
MQEHGRTRQSTRASAKREKSRVRWRAVFGTLVGILLLTGVCVFYGYGDGSLKEFFRPTHSSPGISNQEPNGEQSPETEPIETADAMEKALQARGVYVTMDVFGTPSQFKRVITFVRENPGLNCFVVDVKDNNGRIPCTPTGDFNIPARIGGYEHFSALVDVLAEEEYYMIARVVAFQDPYLANLKPEQAIRNADGSLWRDRDGRLWLNPYDERNWEFIRDIALWACEMGFDEVQLDYVRFPDSARGLEQTSVLMPGSEKFGSRGDAIAAFLEYMDDALEGKGFLSADVFGFVTIAQDDMGIGQKLEQLASLVDFISPMVYPSHYYNAGIYGFEVPEAHPSEVVYKAMEEAIQRTDGLKARIRPWLQDFSMRIKYGPKEVQAQIDSVYEHGIETFMLWNPANVYTDGVTYLNGESIEP